VYLHHFFLNFCQHNSFVDCFPSCAERFYLQKIFVNPDDPFSDLMPFHPLSCDATVGAYSSTGKNYGWSESDDIAVLKASKNSTSFIKLDDTNCKKDDILISVHYPTGWDLGDVFPLRDGSINGIELNKLFGSNRKIISVGNITKVASPETMNHNLLTWSRSSGAGIVNIKTGKICGVHVGGSYHSNYAHTVAHPFLNKILDELKVKDEL